MSLEGPYSVLKYGDREMSGAREYLQVKFLRTLEPLGSLSIDKLEEIANKSRVEELPPGRVVFRQGEKDSRSTYLLSGSLELQVTGNPRTEVLKAKTADSRYPIAQEWPRPSTCRCKTNVVLLHIDSDLLEILLSNDPSGTYEVTEIGVHEDPESDWMLKFLQSPAFLQLPTANIQAILVKLEEVPVKAGDVIIKQGSVDDYYYIVKLGKCSVSRRPAPKTDEIRLAILGPGDGFGEEALITNGKRNATVTAKETGVLMRLGKADFHELLVTPMLREIDHTTMMSKVKAGAALLDVRTNKEFNNNGIQGAQNIPLSMMRIKSKDLNSTREHIVYCNDSSQSRAAAFLLAQQSLDVFVLKGGLSKQNKPFSPVTTAKTSSPATPTAPVAIENTKPAPSTVALPELNDKAYTEHKQHAEQSAKKASNAESNRKLVGNKTDKLHEQSNALLAQADRLANKTAIAEQERQKTQAEIDALKQEALEQREKILASAKNEVAKGKELARQQELETNKIREEAELARRRAEEELAKIKAESQSVEQKQSELDAELKRAEIEKQQAERAADVARLMAQQEAETVRAEAEAVKQKAFKEAEHIRSELEARKTKMLAEEKRHQETALNEARRKAELSVAEASKAAEEARRQASLEAEAIRRQALKEAESIRMQMEREKQSAAEQAARYKAEEELKRQEIEQERQKTLESARIQAETEAEVIRQKAIQEAQIQAREEARRNAEVEAQEIRQKTIKQAHQEAREEAHRLAEAEARDMRQQTLQQLKLEREQAIRVAELEAEAIRKQTIEEVSRKAMETAQLEADAIRRAAIEEASRLRAEMEETRQLVESEAARARSRIEQESAELLANQETARTESAREAAVMAAQKVERRAFELEAEQEARQQSLQLEEQRIAEQQARIAAQVEQQRQAEQQRQVEARRLQQANDQARRQSDQRSLKAQQMAKSLRTKLDKHESALQEDDYNTNMGRGLKLAKAKLHVVKDKTILEGEEDIFIFKAPSARPPSREEAEKLLQQAEVQLARQSRNELPSFDLDYADEESDELVIDQESEFSDSILLELDNITANSAPAPKPRSSVEDDHFGPIKDAVADSGKHGRKRSSLIALAASVVVMVTISVVAITQPTYLEVEQVATVSEQQQPTRGLAAIRARTGNNKTILEDKIKSEAEDDFNKMLSKWRKQK